MRMNLGLQMRPVQKMSQNCPTCGKGLVDIPEHLDDEKSQDEMIKVREPGYVDQCEPLIQCPKCGKMVLASRLRKDN